MCKGNMSIFPSPVTHGHSKNSPIICTSRTQWLYHFCCCLYHILPEGQ